MSVEPVDRWSALVSAALVGTSRRSPEAVDLLGAGIEADPAQQLLLEVAVLDVAHRAAPAISSARSPVEPSPHETRRGAPYSAYRLLDLVLGDSVPYRVGRDVLLAEWLTACADAGWRVEHEHLPALLDLGASTPALRHPIRRAIGTRGPWLATLFPNWSWCAADTVEWDSLSRSARRAALARMLTDDLTAARPRWQRLYETEPADERARLLALLAPHLDATDDDLVEAALDDRSLAVRRAALDMAHRVPGGRHRQRMACRLAALVDDSGPALRVGVPARLDADDRRDGLGTPLDEPPLDGGDADVARVIGAVDLAWWEGRLACDAAAVVDELPNDPAVAVGFFRAAVAQQRTDFLTALFRRFGGARWLGQLPSAIAQAVVVDAGAPDDGDDLTGVIRVVDGPWSPEFSRLVLDALRRRPPDARPRDCVEVRTTQELGERIAPSLAEPLDNIASTIGRDHPGARAWRSIAGAVTFRASIAAAF